MRTGRASSTATRRWTTRSGAPWSVTCWPCGTRSRSMSCHPTCSVPGTPLGHPDRDPVAARGSTGTMTAGSDAHRRSRARRPGRPSTPAARRPPTGWGSVLLLFLMLLTAGLAMDVPRLAGIGPGGSRTAFLPLVMVLSGLVGSCSRRSPLPAHGRAPAWAPSWASACCSCAGPTRSRMPHRSPPGCRPSTRPPPDLFQDVVIERGRTEETIGFLIVVGAIAWTTGQFAAYNVVAAGHRGPRHRRHRHGRAGDRARTRP